MKAEKLEWAIDWHRDGNRLVATFSPEASRRGNGAGASLELPEIDPPADTLVLRIPHEHGDDPAILPRLHRLCRLATENGIEPGLEELPESTRRLLLLSNSTPLTTAAEEKRPVFLARIGFGSFAVRQQVVAVIGFMGQIALSLGTFLTGRSVTRPVDILSNFGRCGPGSLLIVSLIAFLVGLIISFVAAVQLAIFGATIFVADLISIVMFRELGVIMTGVLLSGRIGAAFAAELGSMRNNEEIDALTTSGVNPIQFLVIPRFIAMVLATPLLSIYASFIGVLGGLLMASGLMGIVPEQFFTRVEAAMTLGNLWAGFIKGFVFGAIIAITGCMKGLNAARGAEGVGAAATSAVVTSITWIIIADAVFAVLLFFMGV